MILVVDDIEEVAVEHSQMIEKLGFSCQYLTDPRQVIPFLKREPQIELICLDMRMPRLSGLELLRQIKIFNPNIGVIIATIVSDIRAAVKATRQGAYNYLLKPLQIESLYNTVQSFFKNRPAQIVDDPRFSSFITQSPLFKDIFTKISMLSDSTLPILIQGETGTGKEIIAHLIHQLSPRKDEAYVPLNISSLQNELVQAELFGHEKGSFTGAEKKRNGFFNQAGQGTLFLDEIGELPLDQQKNLLRVLQDGSYYPVGSSQAQKANCRLIFATNRDLKKEVQAGRFREDLFFRICHANIELPPLRKRPEDIEVLANYFFQKYCAQHGRALLGILPKTIALLRNYPFHGNVRELEGLINVSVLLEQNEYLSDDNLPDYIRKAPPPLLNEQENPLNLDVLRRRAILEALEQTGQHQTRAAELLGISRSTLHRFLNEGQ